MSSAYDREEFFSPQKKAPLLLTARDGVSINTPLISAGHHDDEAPVHSGGRRRFVKPPKPTLCQSLGTLVWETADELKWFAVLFAAIAIVVTIVYFSSDVAREWLIDHQKTIIECAILSSCFLISAFFFTLSFLYSPLYLLLCHLGLLHCIAELHSRFTQPRW